MINWKTSMGLTLMPIAAILILEIKDFSAHQHMKSTLQLAEVALLFTAITSIILLVQGIRHKSIH